VTVAELIAELEAYPPGTRVLVDGYESGYDEPELRDRLVRHFPRNAWWNGDWTRDNNHGEYAVIVGRP
jgi:hypothetical protein